MGKLKSIYNRVYSDFFLPSRIKEYEKIITTAKENGYTHISINDYFDKLISNEIGDTKYFIHRHDIDTDLRTTRKIFEVEKKQNIKSTYYFRRSTLDIELMKKINQFGSEASYHFEEVATYCKDNKLKTKKEALNKIEEITSLFKANFTTIESKVGYKLTTVASHGDFVNRKLSLINNVITDNKELRKELGIKCETYDPLIKNSFNSYISDTLYPSFYRPENIFNIIGKHQVICLLSHPRHWESNAWINLKDNFTRVYEGLIFKFF